MKNYIDEARKYNVRLYNIDKCLQSYRIDKEYNRALLGYMNGHMGIKNLDETSKEKLDEQQRSDLKLIEASVNEKTSFEIKFNGVVSGIYAFVGVCLKGLQFTSSYIWLFWAGHFLFKALKPMRLRKDIQLAGWIYDNKEKVNEVIQDEVYEKSPNLKITATTLNAPLAEYPKDLVPYSKTMFKEGIDLNNIDELDNKTLRHLKRKVLQKERKKNNLKT